MIPAFLITFREVIEASLIVATVLGILVKLNRKKAIRSVFLATGAAGVASFVILVVGSLLGLRIQEIYSGKTEEIIEGILMIISALFITWAVFFLHNYFSRYKIHLLKKIKDTLETSEQTGLFTLVFTAVFREGFEIVLFLSTIYFSSDPTNIVIGFTGGVVAGLMVSLTLFTAAIRLPVYMTFRVTSALLILFAGGLLARGIHEFAEAGFFPEIGKITFAFIPHSSTFIGSIIKALFGLTTHMDLTQLAL